MSAQQHEEAHTGPIKTPSQAMWVSMAAFVLPVFIIIGLVFFVVSDKKPAAGTTNMEKSVAERIQKVGTVEIRDANRPLKSGEAVYQAQCIACHGAGLAGAPKFGDRGAWAARIKNSFDSLVNSALKGKGAMSAQGGGEHNDTEVARAVAFMANAAGAKFAEPAAPAAAK
ncbi:c-type cytochrome [Hylemonella gracilis]|uniref:Class I cytochrome c n=1 Tax=Hylemonella gracilis ATCC 19624 TaxID=887062 RepID=F3KQQ9_9BURK|nr:c-type cytochrome [Hylemonella gracilis]EGI77933.1 class I cytochrome c [Hylemonella gracilis ATCC 19624]